MDNAKKGKGGYLVFEDSWYDLDHDATPDGSDVKATAEKLGASI